MEMRGAEEARAACPTARIVAGLPPDSPDEELLEHMKVEAPE